MIDWKRVGFSTSMKGFGSLIRTEGPKDRRTMEKRRKSMKDSGNRLGL